VERSKTSPDEFIALLADDVRDDIATLDATITGALPGLDRVLWEGVFWGGTMQRIIGYGTYSYTGRSGAAGEWFVVGLAAQKSHLSLYVNAAKDGAYVGQQFAPRLGKVKAGKANITFKRASDVNLDVLRELVVAARDATPDAS
jgi:hypothetical protein